MITKTGYAGYFLIVYDFIKAARDRDIPVGPGRGSAAGSIVAYALQHHRRLPAQVRPAVRALPESGTRVDARHRRRLLLRAARRGDRVRAAEVRPRVGRPDRHLRDDEVARRHQGRRPHARLHAGRDRRAREADPERPGLLAHREGSDQESARDRDAVRDRRALPAAARLRDRARRAVAPRGRARRRRRDRAGSARRLRARSARVSSKGAGAGSDETRRRHAVRHELPREGRHAQDGLPRPHDAHGHPRRARQHRARGTDVRPDLDTLDARRSRGRTACCARAARPACSSSSRALATDMLRSMRCDRFDDLVATQRADASGPARRRDAQGLSSAEARRGAGHATRCPSSSRSSSRRTASSPIRNR